MFEHVLRRLGLDAGSRRQAKALAAQVEQLIDGCDRRLRLLPDYQRALAPGLRVSQDYLSGLLEQLPPPLRLSLPFSRDPRLGLLFSGPSSLLQLLDGSAELREFFLSASNGDEVWALLSMQRSETRRFGAALEGGELRNDVAQVVVSFDGHRLMMPSVSDEALLRQSGAHALDVLCAVIARHLGEREQARQLAEVEQTRLMLRRRALGADDCTVIDGGGDCGDLPDTLSGVDARLAELAPRLAALREDACLEGMLRQVRRILERPADYFSLRAVTLHLNRMGVQAEPGGDGVAELRLKEVVLGREQSVRRALLPVRIRRDDIAELRRRFGDD
ncbi:hypothetical protein ACPRNU_04730 [Chromobacterium vaccinii]|uniref:hypothetical protein n=1 Tax=Chromobacterium vaccinii TaxID=1108595 RepID=UPI003C730158